MIADLGLSRITATAHRLWVWLNVPQRNDSLLCAVLVLEDAVIVKTVMHHWELMP